MTGPIDESRHPIVHVGEAGSRQYTPRPWRELTPEEELRVRDLAAIERWLIRLYAERARRRRAAQPPDATERR